MNRSDPYDIFVVIPEGCDNWIRLDYHYTNVDQADRTAIQDWIAASNPGIAQAQMFTRHRKQGVVPYIRFYFKYEADAAIFKLTFAHLKLVSKSHW